MKKREMEEALRLAGVMCVEMDALKSAIAEGSPSDAGEALASLMEARIQYDRAIVDATRGRGGAR